MRLSEKALQAINKRDPRFELARVLDCSEESVRRYIKENALNGELTKLAALEVIRKETGLSDSEILETVTQSTGV